MTETMHVFLAIGGKPLEAFGLILGVAGALCIAWAKAGWLSTTESVQGGYLDRVRTLIGASLVAAAFAILLIHEI